MRTSTNGRCGATPASWSPRSRRCSECGAAEMRAVLRRPAWLAAATVLAVCVPSTEHNASTAVTVSPADLVSVALVVVVGLDLLRRGRPRPDRAWLAFAAAALGFTVATVCAADPFASLSG